MNPYDALILDGGSRQSLASTRSLGRAGLRVAVAECFAECDPSLPVLSFQSRYCARQVVLPSYASDPAAFAGAVVDFVRGNPTRMVLPTTDGSIAALAAHRDELAELGCTLALAPAQVLAITNDKDQTLAVASELGIPYPASMTVSSLDQLPEMVARFGFPIVLKPAISWAGHATVRLQATEAVDEAEATKVISNYLEAGSDAIAQEWMCGNREGVTLFMVDGQVLASCAHLAWRTSPALGGASVMRESLPLLSDLFEPSVMLTRAVGMQGVCEVEFRRDSAGRPMLMEINTRLAGTIENAVRSGVDFPLLIWLWATGGELPAASGRNGDAPTTTPYRTGVRTRWLHGDLRWLRDNSRRIGRPDSFPRSRALWMFGSDFFRARHYDSLDWHDLRPAVAEFRITAATVRKSLRAPAGTREVTN